MAPNDSYKYLEILLDNKLCFKVDNQQLFQKIKMKQGFCTGLKVVKRETTVQSTLTLVLDPGDILYYPASTVTSFLPQYVPTERAANCPETGGSAFVCLV